ncbi:hypothetical protein [Streptomyces sp. NPDC002763]|uniref:hypothetical protein n=1 Tax=Streptomyces sp. NPDC002763 TaxID=3154427 RepID=UPI003328A581
MRLRKIGTAAGVVMSAMAVAVLTSGTAHAATYSIQSGYSSPGGYGRAEVSMSGGSYNLVACDAGPADGNRAVAYIWNNSTGFYDYKHAASGSGVCETEGWEYLPSPTPGTYYLQICLRNGASGADFACRTGSFYYNGLG